MLQGNVGYAVEEEVSHEGAIEEETPCGKLGHLRSPTPYEVEQKNHSVNEQNYKIL